MVAVLLLHEPGTAEQLAQLDDLGAVDVDAEEPAADRDWSLNASKIPSSMSFHLVACSRIYLSRTVLPSLGLMVFKTNNSHPPLPHPNTLVL
ncbi:hypothetical protein Halar_2805 [halophilic archaeon DL31]|nr:hypothetical protein Halar_2805 [halophilic archaeon DL31]